MKWTNNNAVTAMLFVVLCIAVVSCQKEDRPALGDYPADSNPPGGPLKFYAAFDGTSSDVLLNGVDSIRATFPADNPLAITDGISGKALQGANQKFIKYPKANDWASQAKSFTISFWEKKDGQTQNNKGGNGPEYPFSFRTNPDDFWSAANMFLLLEGDNTSCALKLYTTSADSKDSWLTWEGGTALAGVLDNQWHHFVLVYDASTSKLTLYVDGVANSHVPEWAGHGDINIADSKITELRIGGGPGTNYDTDDWLSSTWKGSLDQFRFYNTVLSASEVSALFASKQ